MDVRLLTADDLDEYFAVRVQAFGMAGTDADRTIWRAFVDAGSGPVFGAYDGRLLGALRVLPAGQHLAGRRVGMGGIAGVVVRPEARGRGVARTLLAESLAWMHAEGIAVSSLHPASTRVYRSAGWEIAGEAGLVAIPTRSLAAIRTDGGRGVIDRLGPGDRAELEAVYGRWAPTVHGTLDRTGAFWDMHAAWSAMDGTFTYGVRHDGLLTGYVKYEQQPREGWGYAIRVEDVVAPDAATAAELWHFLGAHAMQVEQVEVPLASLPELLLLLDEQDDVPVRANRWMHRVVDVGRFMNERGFGPGDHSVTVTLTDPWSAGVGGTWALDVHDGGGAATPTSDAGEVTTDVGAFSALTIGGFTAADLVTAGRLSGTVEACATLASMFATPAPRISDDF